MKRFILFLILFLSLSGFAQNKFIEVEVTDTVSLKPVKFNLNVYSDATASYDFNDNEEYDPTVAEEKAKNILEGAKKIVESKKYKIVPLDNSGIGLFQQKTAKEKGFTVPVNGSDEVKKLEEMLKAVKGIETIVTVTKYADEQKAEDDLIKKLIDKAKARAGVIAAASGLKVGKILEIREGKSSNGLLGIDFYAQIAKMGNWMSQTADYKGELSKTFLVKFAAE